MLKDRCSRQRLTKDTENDKNYYGKERKTEEEENGISVSPRKKGVRGGWEGEEEGKEGQLSIKHLTSDLFSRGNSNVTRHLEKGKSADISKLKRGKAHSVEKVHYVSFPLV